jgi:hypothetical protein
MKITSSFDANVLVTAFQAGACFCHHPHPSEAIQRTKTVLPASISLLILEA